LICHISARVTTSSARPCPTCNGRGKVPENPCPACRGDGVRKREEEIHVVVPAGIDDGEMIRMPGRGEAAPGGGSGDLYVKLHVRPDAAFTREGNNLLTSVSLKLSEALLGVQKEIRTIAGTTTITIPAGTGHGETIRVRGEGVPYGRGNRGDLVVRIDISMPKKLSRKARELIDELRSEGI
jgi:molecular chaperone DnaJ